MNHTLAAMFHCNYIWENTDSSELLFHLTTIAAHESKLQVTTDVETQATAHVVIYGNQVHIMNVSYTENMLPTDHSHKARGQTSTIYSTYTKLTSMMCFLGL